MNNTTGIKPPKNPSGLETKLLSTVERLTLLSLELRKALVQQNSNAIWDVMAKQEEQALLLDEYGRLWNEMNGSDENLDKETASMRKFIRRHLVKLRAVQSTNASLAQSFLSAIRKAMNTVGKKYASKRNTYTSKGRMGINYSSVLVRKFG